MPDFVLPQGFIEALKDEVKDKARAIEQRYEEEIAELLRQGRKNALELKEEEESSLKLALANAEQEHLRALRDIENRSLRQLLHEGTDELKQRVQSKLKELRDGEAYRHWLHVTAVSALPLLGNVVRYCCLSQDQKFLPFDADFSPLPEDSLGGFIAWGEEGTVFDCRLETRLESLNPTGMVESLLQRR